MFTQCQQNQYETMSVCVLYKFNVALVSVT